VEIFGVITAFVKQQNDSLTTVKQLKTMKNEMRSNKTTVQQQLDG